MTMMWMMMLMTWMSFAIMWTKNPVKLSMTLMLTSLLLFFYMYISTSQAWFPLLFSMLFLGGILMMFMILSSILPNKKMKKSKILIFPILTSTFMFKMPELSEVQTTSPQIKSFLNSASSMLVMMTLILLYFFIFVSMLSKEESPMRSVWCHKKNNFVNYM